MTPCSGFGCWGPPTDYIVIAIIYAGIWLGLFIENGKEGEEAESM
jgi:hypothetical protein